MEDLAGVAIVRDHSRERLVAGYEAISGSFIRRRCRISGLWSQPRSSALLGNEAVAVFRIRAGKEIGSAALVADGHHARVDGFTSLAVLFGALGVWLGYPLADPLVGLFITLMIFRIVWDSAKSVFRRLLDGVDPEVLTRSGRRPSRPRG